MMQLYFIRHGQSTNNAIYQETEFYDKLRVSDPSLTAKGEQQAQAVAQFFLKRFFQIEDSSKEAASIMGFGLTHIYCGLMERALQTGAIISKKLGVPLYGSPDMHEIGGIFIQRENNGEVIISEEHGISPDDLKLRYPGVILTRAIDACGWWPGGIETWSETLRRAQDVADFLVDKHANSEDKIAVITHAGFFECIFRNFFGIAQKDTWNEDSAFLVALNNCGVTRFDLKDGKWIFIYHNRIDFLPEDLIS